MQALPARVLVGFTQVGRGQRTSVRVYNTHHAPARFHLATRDSQSIFKVSLDKHSTLAPGMCDVLTVECSPMAYKYYREIVRLSSDTGTTLEIPLEAYPLMNDLINTQPHALFPKHIDFGSCIICSETVKRFELPNVIPELEFDFEIIVLAPHPYFTIHPLKGTIPSSSAVEITVTFSPLEMCTSSCKVKLVCSQYAYVPFVTTICGSAIGPRLDKRQLPQIHPSLPQSTKGTKAAKHSKVPTTAVIDPNLTRSLPAPSDTMEVNGIIFSERTLHTHAGVASVLMQQPGKHKMKEIKARRSKASAGTTGDKPTGEVDGSPERGAQGRQVKELEFGQTVKAYMEYERSKELKWFVCTGRLPFTEDEQKDILREREMLAATSTTIAGRVITPAHSKLTVAPSFDTRKNSPWAIRAWAIKRFVSAVRSVIVQIRASKRLSAMHSFLKKFNYNKALIGELTDWNGSAPASLATTNSTMAGSDDAIASMELKDNQIRYPFFPGFRSELTFFEDGEGGLDPLPAPHIKEIVQVFDELGTFELKTGKNTGLEYHSFSLSSSRAGCYIPRCAFSAPHVLPQQIPVNNIASSLIYGILHTGANEEDLNTLSTIQSLVVSPQPTEKFNQSVESQVFQENEQNTQVQILEEDLQSPQDQSPQDQTDQLSSANALPPTTSYLPPLPQEFLKAPRAGPPNGAFTLDILRTAIVHSSLPQITEADITYPLRPYPRYISLTEGVISSRTLDSAHDNVGSALGLTGGVPAHFTYDNLNSMAHRSSPDTLEGAFVPDLVTSQSFAASFDDALSGPAVDLSAITMQYFIPSGVAGTIPPVEAPSIPAVSLSSKPSQFALQVKLHDLNLLISNQAHLFEW